MSELVTRIQPSNGPMLISISGDVDLYSAPQLRDELFGMPDTDMILDMSGVSFLGAAGLTVLLELRARLAWAHARIVLVAASRSVCRIIALTDLDELLPMLPTVDDAIALLDATRAPECPGADPGGADRVVSTRVATGPPGRRPTRPPLSG